MQASRLRLVVCNFTHVAADGAAQALRMKFFQSIDRHAVLRVGAKCMNFLLYWPWKIFLSFYSPAASSAARNCSRQGKTAPEITLPSPAVSRFSSADRRSAAGIAKEIPDLTPSYAATSA